MDYKINKFIYQFILLCLLFSTISACTTSAVLKKGYIKNSIRVNVNASHDLNFYNRQSHSLVMVIFELSEPNSFKELVKKKENMAKLLSGEAFDGSVLSTLRVTVQPGFKNTLQLDRVEGARYLGVVAGFYNLGKAENYSRLYSVDMYEKKPYYWSKPVTKKLYIDLALSKDGFQGQQLQFNKVAQ